MAAIRFLRSKAGAYGIDPSRVYLWGSAGGHLAALATLTCGVAAFDPPASTGRLPHSQAVNAKPLPQSDCVQGAAIWYGVFDLHAWSRCGQRARSQDDAPAAPPSPDGRGRGPRSAAEWEG